MSQPVRNHWAVVNSILRYLKGTTGKCIFHGKGNLNLYGYYDSDMAGDVDTRTSTYAYIYTLAGGAILWCSQLQLIVAHSTTEAEHIPAATAPKEGIWLTLLCRSPGLLKQIPDLDLLCGRLLGLKDLRCSY